MFIEYDRITISFQILERNNGGKERGWTIVYLGLLCISITPVLSRYFFGVQYYVVRYMIDFFTLSLTIVKLLTKVGLVFRIKKN